MTATISASSLSASGICTGLLAWASLTVTPFCNMRVITMKMISSTSITSTIGVTLMFELTLTPSFRTLIAIIRSWGLPPGHVAAAGSLQEIIDQLAGGVVHFHVKGFDFAGEVVERHHGGNGDAQSQSGGYQRFGNTARDG